MKVLPLIFKPSNHKVLNTMLFLLIFANGINCNNSRAMLILHGHDADLLRFYSIFAYEMFSQGVLHSDI